MRNYNALKKLEWGAINLDSVLDHLQTEPFLGGAIRAQKYIEKYKEVYANILDKFGNRFNMLPLDEVREKPVARLLVAGYRSGGLVGGFDYSGSFIGKK